MRGTHAVVLLDLECVLELLLARTALGAPPLQGHPGNPRPDQPRRQRQSGQGAHGVKHHLCAEATAQKHIDVCSKHWRKLFNLWIISAEGREGEWGEKGGEKDAGVSVY